MSDAPPPIAEPHRPRAHVPVLLGQVVEQLAPSQGQTLLDCTAGQGGHALALAPLLGPAGTLVLNDLDPMNLEAAATRVRALPGAPRVVTLRGNFADAPRRLVELGLAADAVLADLGFASSQMDDASRGFSFMREGPLDMRLDPAGPTTAADLVNSLPEPELAELIRDLGEEPAWRAVARKLVEARGRSPISTTSELASLVRSVVSQRAGHVRIDPATRTFQALRIAVNDELGSLGALLEAVARASAILGRRAAGGEQGSPVAHTRLWLNSGARIAVIAFHSLEDRLVKNAFRDLEARAQGRQTTRRPIEATDAEIATNPRARSAKMRVVHLASTSPPAQSRVV